MRKTIQLITILLLFSASGASQIYNFRNFSYDDGLTHSEINAICEDRNGNLWIGTLGGGLLKYDGYSFTSYTEESGLVNNIVLSLMVDKDGRIWIGTEEGVCNYDGLTFSILDSLHEGPGNNTITALLEDWQNNIWIGTDHNGIYKLDISGYTHYTSENHLTNNRINCLFESSDSAVWIGTDEGVCTIKEDQTTSLTQRDGLSSNLVWGISNDNEGNMWFTTYDGGVCKFTGDSLTNYSINHGLLSRRVYAVINDFNGNLWFGTNRGISKFDGKEFTNYTEDNGLAGNIVVSIFQDSSGSIWFGTSGGGLSQLDSERFVHFPENEKMGKRIFSLIQATNGNMIFGSSEGGITVFDGQQFSHVKGTRGFTSSKVQALYYTPDSNLWIGTIDDGAFEFNKQGFHKYTLAEGLPSNHISDFTSDTAGNVWISTLDSGLCVLSVEHDTIIQISASSGLGSNRVYCLLSDRKGNVWVGTEYGGLHKITIKSVKNPQFSITRYTAENGLANNSVKSMVTDTLGNLYLGTAGGGISIMSDTAFKIIDKQSGLFSNNIYSLIFDQEQRLWVGTERGVDRITLTKDFSVKELIHYGRDQGFRGIDNFRNAVCIDDEGNLWFGTINGVVKYIPELDICKDHLPITHLSRIKLFFRNIEETTFADSLHAWYPIPASLKLPYKQNNLTFEFIGIHLRDPEAVQYRWKLEGFDEDWTPPLKQREVTYSNLPPGDYTFHITSGNELNQWNEDPISYTFSISPPFWKEFWFRAGAILLISLIITGIIFMRFRRIKIKNKLEQERLEMEKNIIELEQEAARLQMNPHFIFNSLNSIQGFIASNEPYQAKRYLAKFARLMRLILENAREEYIPLQNEIDILDNYLQLEKLRTNDKFDFSIKLDKEINAENTEIPPMMIQPFVENAIVHGILGKEGHGNIDICFRMGEKSLFCDIVDDGIGREQASKKKLQKSPKHKSTGISVTKKRLEQLKTLLGKEAGVSIEDLYLNGKPSGTKVSIQIPSEFD